MLSDLKCLEMFRFHRGGTTIYIPTTSFICKFIAVVTGAVVFILVISFTKSAVLDASPFEIPTVLDRKSMNIANFLNPCEMVIPVMTDYIKQQYQVVDENGDPLPPGSTKGDIEVVRLVNGMTTLVDDISILIGVKIPGCYYLALCIVKDSLNRVKKIAAKSSSTNTKISLEKSLEALDLVAYYADETNVVKSENGVGCKDRFKNSCPKYYSIAWFDKIYQAEL